MEQQTDPAGDGPTRRGVLIGGVAAAAAACAFCAGDADAATTKPASRPTTKPAAGGPVDAGPVAAFKQDGVYDALAKSQKLLIFRHGPTLYAASSRCTHRGCVLVKAVRDQAQLKCPCHNSEFDLDGIPLDGPARTSLARFAIKVEKGRVIVDPSTTFEERHWKDAGASVKV